MALCVFAPDSYFDFNEEQDRDPTTIDFSTFDEEIYRISPWPRLNGLANGVPIDVRLIPDLKNLLPDKETQTFQFKNFEAALDQVVTEFQRHFAAQAGYLRQKEPNVASRSVGKHLSASRMAKSSRSVIEREPSSINPITWRDGRVDRRHSTGLRMHFGVTEAAQKLLAENKIAPPCLRAGSNLERTLGGKT